jgi:hypothetical protein
MDLDAELPRRDGHGRHDPLDPALLPPLYLAFAVAADLRLKI